MSKKRKVGIRFMKYVLTVQLLMSIAVMSATVAEAAYKMITYTTVKQAKSNWCWAASAENSVRGSISGVTRTQEDAVREIKGTVNNPYPDTTGSLEDMDRAAEYISDNRLNYGYTPLSTTNGVKTYSFLRLEINASQIPILDVGYYSNGLRTGGHAVVMVGYSSSDSVFMLYYIDPKNNARYGCTYEQFKNGYCQGGNYDGTVWIK